MKSSIINYQLLIIILFASSSAFSQNLSDWPYPALDSMTNIHYENGAFDQAIPYMQAAVDKAKAEFGDMDSTYSYYLNELGYFYKQMGQYDKAEQLYLKSKKIDAKVFGIEHDNYANTMSNLAVVYQRQGRYKEAEQTLLEVIKIRSKVLGEQHLNFAISLNNLANVYHVTGNYEKAEPLYLKIKGIFEKSIGEDHPIFSNVLNNLAYLYTDMEQYEKAESLYLQAISIAAKLLGEQHPYYATALNNLATLYRNMNKYEASESLYLKSMKIHASVLGEDNPEYAAILVNLGGLYYFINQHDKAEMLLLKAKNIIAKTSGKEHPDYASCLNNWAHLCASAGNYKKAEDLYFEYMVIWEHIYGTENLAFAGTINNISQMYLAMGKLDTALLFCLKSIDFNSAEINSSFYAKEANGAYQAAAIESWGTVDKFKYYSNDRINESIDNLLMILKTKYKKTGDKTTLEIVHKITQAAMRLNERICNDFNEESAKLRSLANNYHYVLQGIETATTLKKEGYVQESFGFAEMNKGVLLMNAVKTERAYSFGDLPDSLAWQEKILQKKHADLEAALLENQPNEIKDSLVVVMNKTKQEIDQFTKVLKTHYPKYAAIKYENKFAKSADIQAILDGKTALLEYVIGDSILYIFYIDKQNVLLEQKRLNVKELVQKTKDLHDVLSNYELLAKDASLSYKKYTKNAHWFYEQLVAPALQHAKGISNLVIVSDGELGHLPFESFLVEPAPQKETSYKELHYLVNDYTISYNYSATLFAEYQQQSKHKTGKHPNNGQILAMASDYEIKMDTSASLSTKKNWRLPTHQRLRALLNPLPEAKKEVETLKESFQGFFGLEKEATEKVFKEKAGDYAIIHLAMHGILDAKTPILSSLAFTEDGDSVENNFLHAYEISKMKLNADLVVLSACETGYGRFDKGNGIASLAQAFAYAGAPALIVSLWQVNDYATSEMMKNLYQNLSDGMNKDKALQEAKLEYIKAAQGLAAHPAFWSPFILMGNTDAITLGRTRGLAPTWIIGGILVVLGGIAFAMRKRQTQ